MTNHEIRLQMIDAGFTTPELLEIHKHAKEVGEMQIARVSLAMYLRRRKMEAGY